MADSTVAAMTGVAKIDGDELLYGVDDPAGTPLDRKFTANAVRGPGSNLAAFYFAR